LRAAHSSIRRVGESLKPLAALGIALSLLACAGLRDESLAGKIWDARAGAFVAPEELFDHAAHAQYVILGETHDNPEHHRLQRVVLDALATRGGTRLLAMEQFDAEYQAALDRARTSAVDAETLADAGHFDRAGWQWPLYRPLVQFALERGWPLAAANLSRKEARAIVADPARSRLPPADPSVTAALARDIGESHCGKAPEGKLLQGMVEAQRARDARMASALKGPSVLIAGAGHARRDRGVPLYLGDHDVVIIAFIEVEEGKTVPQDYFDGFATAASFDYVWFTPRAAREDPCA
jgi:uncharacterized iron-regulated protein